MEEEDYYTLSLIALIFLVEKSRSLSPQTPNKKGVITGWKRKNLFNKESNLTGKEVRNGREGYPWLMFLIFCSLLKKQMNSLGFNKGIGASPDPSPNIPLKSKYRIHRKFSFNLLFQKKIISIFWHFEIKVMSLFTHFLCSPCFACNNFLSIQFFYSISSTVKGKKHIDWQCGSSPIGHWSLICF